MSNNLQPRFQPRARFCGTLDWLCPYCGYLNRMRVTRKTWRVRCRASECRRRLAIGVLFRSLAGGEGQGNRTIPPPDITFPEVEFDIWKPGGPVHRFADRN